MSDDDKNFSLTKFNQLVIEQIPDGQSQLVTINHAKQPYYYLAKYLFLIYNNPLDLAEVKDEFFTSDEAFGSTKNGVTSAVKDEMPHSLSSSPFVNGGKFFSWVSNRLSKAVIFIVKFYLVSFIVYNFLTMLNYIFYSLTSNNIEVPQEIGMSIFIGLGITLGMDYVLKLIPIISDVLKPLMSLILLASFIKFIIDVFKLPDITLIYFLISLFFTLKDFKTIAHFIFGNPVIRTALLLISFFSVLISIMNPNDIANGNVFNSRFLNKEIPILYISLIFLFILILAHIITKKGINEKVAILKEYLRPPQPIFKTQKIEYQGFLNFTSTSYNFSPAQIMYAVRNDLRVYEDIIEADDYSKVYGYSFLMLGLFYSLITTFSLTTISLSTPYVKTNKDEIALKFLVQCEYGTPYETTLNNLPEDQLKTIKFFKQEFKAVKKTCDLVVNRKDKSFLDNSFNERYNKVNVSNGFLSHAPIGDYIDSVTDKYLYVFEKGYDCNKKTSDIYINSICNLLTDPYYRSWGFIDAIKWSIYKPHKDHKISGLLKYGSVKDYEYSEALIRERKAELGWSIATKKNIKYGNAQKSLHEYIGVSENDYLQTRVVIELYTKISAKKPYIKYKEL